MASSRRAPRPGDGRDASTRAPSPPTSSCSGSPATATAFLAALEARGVLMVAYPHGQIRAVTHYGITAEDVDRVVAAVDEVLRETAPVPAPEPAGSVA